MSGWTLHPRLAADCLTLGDLPLCRVLIMNDRQYPWLILVPRRPDIREAHELDEEDYSQLWLESRITGQVMMAELQGHKLNIAALGNLVPQLHLHHVVRFENDPAWPGPVWGVRPPEPYADRGQALGMRLFSLIQARLG